MSLFVSDDLCRVASDMRFSIVESSISKLCFNISYLRR